MLSDRRGRGCRQCRGLPRRCRPGSRWGGRSLGSHCGWRGRWRIPIGGPSALAESAQPQLFAIGEDGVNVGEFAHPAGQVELPRTRGRGQPPRRCRLDLGLNGAALAGRRRDQTLAAPVLDPFLATPTSRSRPDGRSTCTPGSMTESNSAKTTTSSPPMRSPACRPGNESTPAARHGPAGDPCWSSRSLAVTAPWPTSPPTTSTTPT